MSGYQIRDDALWALARSGLLKPTAFAVGIVLAIRLNSKTGVCYPSEVSIARDIGLDVGDDEDDAGACERKLKNATKTVRRAFAQLETAGLWEITERARGSRSHRYAPLKRGADRPPLDPGPNSPPTGFYRTDQPPGGGQSVLREGANQSPEPLKEPRKEPALSWSEIYAAEQRNDPDRFVSWFKGLVLVEETESCITLAAPNAFWRDHVLSHHKHAWQGRLGKEVRITVNTGQDRDHVEGAAAIAHRAN